MKSKDFVLLCDGVNFEMYDEKDEMDRLHSYYFNL